MKDKLKQSLRVAFYSLDERSQKIMAEFLRGPCSSIKTKVVDEAEAEVDIVDADSVDSKQLLKKCLKRLPRRPIILLSVEIINTNQDDNVILLRKPLVSAAMLQALRQVYAAIRETGQHDTNPTAPAVTLAESLPSPYNAVYSKHTEKTFIVPPASEVLQIPSAHADKGPIDVTERQKTAKYQPPLQLDEKDFAAYIDTIPDISGDSPQRPHMTYNPKDYYQGYVQAAYKTAYGQKRVLKLNSGWKPLTILPQSNEVWIDADDQQVRAFAAIKADSNEFSVDAVDAHTLQSHMDLDKIQEIDAFLWKLALWTSKGRLPAAIDIHNPVYLRRWPNFTRYLVTPHALRIAALMVNKGPQTLTNVASLLNIELRYVCVFISAAYAVGLAGQARRQADLLIAPELPAQTRHKSLLDMFINKLRRG